MIRIYFFTLYFIIFLSCTAFAQKNIATFSRKGSNEVKRISLDEVKLAYQVVLGATLNSPTPNQFMRDYLRYRIAVEEAYNDKTLIQSAKIKNMIVDSGLKENFEQILYKAFADKKMQRQIRKVDVQLRKLSNQQLMRFYRKNPFVNFQYIVISLPLEPTKSQIRTLKKRADNLYKKIVKSKQGFNKMIQLYSDNPYVGMGLVAHSKENLYPLLYDKLKIMKSQQISRPVQTPNGFYIMKSNQIVPFNQVNKEEIKRQYYAVKKSEIFNSYFNKIQANYNININSKILKTL